MGPLPIISATGYLELLLIISSAGPASAPAVSRYHSCPGAPPRSKVLMDVDLFSVALVAGMLMLIIWSTVYADRA